jgi:hypothetical protein
MSVIKGSFQVLQSSKGRLSSDAYAALSQRRQSSLSARQRMDLYSMYRQYEVMKRRAGDWDSADFSCHVYR